MLRYNWPLVLVFAIGACSSEDGAKPDVKEGNVEGNVTWTGSNLEISEANPVVVRPGATLTIAPGTTIRCSRYSNIIVAGTLRTTGGVKISCRRWIGIIVAKGGTLDLDGIELENAYTSIELTKETAPATVKNSVLRGTQHPFIVREGSKLTLTGTKIFSQPDASEDGTPIISDVFGTLEASRIEYDAAGWEGVMVKKGGTAKIEDSTFSAKNGGDLIATEEGAKNLTVRYSTMNGAHCGPHVQGADSFEFDHITSESNSFGLTVYGAGAGPNIVRDSNLIGDSAWLDAQGTHGAWTIENVFTQGTEIFAKGAAPEIKSKAPARIDNAKPR
jgi:hypothetical protein